MKTTEQKPLSYKTPWNVKYSVPSNPYVKHHIRSGNRVVALVNPTLNDIHDTTDETAPEGRVHAAYIVKACNMHQDLLGALGELETIEAVADEIKDYANSARVDSLRVVVKRFRELLARARQ